MIRRVLAVFITLAFAGAASAAAQGTQQPPKPAPKQPVKPAPKVKKDPKWAIEVFGGGGFGGGTGGDGTTTFPAGETFTTEAGFPSRAVPSWYFGDGTALFNEVRAQFASRFNITMPQMVALDPVLADGGFERGAGGNFGVRLTRTLTPRYSLEFALQFGRSSLGYSDSARSEIEASRESFDAAFRGLLGTMPQTGLQVSSTADIPETENASQTAVTGALNIFFSRTRRTFMPYVTAGLGWRNNSVDTQRLQLRGQYQFRFFDVNPFNETDTVAIRTSDRESGLIGVFGGGALYSLTPRQGLKFDARVHAGSNGIESVFDATPTIASLSPPLALPSTTNPGIQFSNTPTVKTSLSGRTSTQTVFTGSGLDARIHLTVAYFYRF